MDPDKIRDKAGEVEKCDLRIEGMTCGSCVEVSNPIYWLVLALTFTF